MTGRPAINRVGHRYGRLVVLRRAENRGEVLRWICICDCGNETIVDGGNLVRAHIKSCGCLGREATSHGYARRGKKSAEYLVWASMRQRCENSENSHFEYYGGRGIKVCDRWKDFQSFLADMGSRPSGRYTIERINNDGDYEPTNCRWATYREQARNTRRNVIVTLYGESMPLVRAVEKFGGRYGLILHRIHEGWPHEAAFGLPRRPAQ